MVAIAVNAWLMVELADVRGLFQPNNSMILCGLLVDLACHCSSRSELFCVLATHMIPACSTALCMPPSACGKEKEPLCNTLVWLSQLPACDVSTVVTPKLFSLGVGIDNYPCLPSLRCPGIQCTSPQSNGQCHQAAGTFCVFSNQFLGQHSSARVVSGRNSSMWWSLRSEQSWLRLHKACGSCLDVFPLHLNPCIPAREQDNLSAVFVANSPQSDSRGQGCVDVMCWDC